MVPYTRGLQKLSKMVQVRILLPRYGSKFLTTLKFPNWGFSYGNILEVGVLENCHTEGEILYGTSFERDLKTEQDCACLNSNASPEVKIFNRTQISKSTYPTEQPQTTGLSGEGVLSLVYTI